MGLNGTFESDRERLLPEEPENDERLQEVTNGTAEPTVVDQVFPSNHHPGLILQLRA